MTHGEYAAPEQAFASVTGVTYEITLPTEQGNAPSDSVFCSPDWQYLLVGAAALI